MASPLVYVLVACRSRIGHAFDAIRQDETVAVTLGISAVAPSGARVCVERRDRRPERRADGHHNRSVAPEEFGFGMLVTVLAYVVLGGRRSVLGPLVGAAILSRCRSWPARLPTTASSCTARC